MKIYIETYGCSANQNNSEIMAGLLHKEKYSLVDSEEKADLIILNTCIVKGPTESKEFSRIKELHSKRKKLLIAGCMPQLAEKKIKAISQDIAILGIDNITEVVRIVELLFEGEAKVLLGKRHELKIGTPKVRKNPAVEIIQIAEGCLGSCAYCSVRFAKGHLHSYPKKDIIAQAKSAVEEGIKELWITSQDNSVYGADIGTNLAALLEELVAIPGDFKIRVGMMNPNHALPMLDSLIEVFASDKVFKFIHLPLQAGSDAVLKSMNRQYTVAQFEKIVAAFKKAFPKINVATDIICGFPEESDADFEKTLSLVKKLEFDVINISKFWLRKGTPAERLMQVPSEKIKQRSKELSLLFDKISSERNKEFLGATSRIIIDEVGKDSFVGRDENYRPVVLKGDFALGEVVSVRITKSKKHYLIGEAI